MLDFVAVQNRVARLLQSPWKYVTGAEPWPPLVYLHPQSSPFGRDRTRLDEWTDEWRAREKDAMPTGTTVEWEHDGPDRMRPRALRFEDVHAAARFVGAAAAARLAQADHAFGVLVDAGASPSPDALRQVVGAVGRGLSLDDVARVVRWVMAHDDLSPWSTRRAGPAAGVDSKWFSDHRRVLTSACGFDVVGEMQDRPRTILFSYVDPVYLASAAHRRHDSWTTGDPMCLPYRPRVVAIVENADTRFSFPPLERGVVVYGGGDAAPAFLSEMPWAEPRPAFIYWGDMDSDGFEILASVRRALDDDVRSLLMDQAAYEQFRGRGTSVDRKGGSIPRKTRAAPLAELDPGERSADLSVCSEGPVRRIEQEAIEAGEVAHALAALGWT